MVTMDFSLPGGENMDDAWGIGVIVETSDRHPNDVAVLWSLLNAVSWEMIAMLEAVDGGG